MRQFIRCHAQEAGWRATDTFFEVGCGAGAFLGSVAAELGGQAWSGLDLSSSLVNAGQGWFPNFDLRIGSADALPLAPPVDHVLAFGVLLYFPNLSYTKRVIELMKGKAQTSVSLLDLPDLRMRSASEAFRRAAWPDGEYEMRYRGLEHLYFSRDEIVSCFDGAEWEVHVHTQDISGYANSPYRFNLFARRRRA